MSSSISRSNAFRHIAVTSATCLGLLALSAIAGMSMFRSAVRGKVRTVNVRVVDVPDRLGLIATQLDVRLSGERRPLVVVLGDSQAYGIGQREARTFSAIVQARRPDRAVLNLSVVDARIGDQLVLLEELRRRRVNIELIVMTLNPAHFVDSHVRRLTVRAPLSPWWHFASPLAIARLGRLLDDKMIDADRSFDGRKPADTQYSADREAERAILASLREALHAAKNLAKFVFFYVPPHAVAAQHDLGYDLSDFHARVAAIMAECRKARGVNCFQWGRLPTEAFQDVVHFSFSGHRLMADMLLREFEDILVPEGPTGLRSQGFSPVEGKNAIEKVTEPASSGVSSTVEPRSRPSSNP